MFEQGHLVAPLALCREQQGVADPEIRNAAVAQFIEVIGGFLSRKGVVVVDVDGLVGRLRRLAHNDMEQPFAAQVRRHRAVLFGIEQDKSIGLCVGDHALDGVQDLGIEPLEFMFMFCAMPLYIVYALLQGCAFAMAGIIHLRLHSFGNLEFITRIPMSLQAGLGGDIINFVICVAAFFVIGYLVAYVMIGKLNLATPGRLGNYTDDNADESAADAKTEKKADKKADNGQAERIIALLGGRENIVLVDACMTRLRVTVKDPAKVADLAAWKAEGALSLLVKGDGIQAVYGPKADVLKSDINDIL